MKEVIGTVGKAVGGAVGAAAPAVVKAPIARPVVRSAPAVTHVTKEVGAGLAKTKESVIPKAAPVPKLQQDFVARIDIAAQSDGHRALTMLAFGSVKSEFVQRVANRLPEKVLQHDFVTLERLGPEKAKGITQEVGKLQLPQRVLDDPVFANSFYEELQREAGDKKALLKNGELTPEEYMQGREQMVRESALTALKERENTKNIDDEDLEKIKRRAALDAIRMHMMVWRQSVMHDKRLTPEAKQRAIIRIDRFERKLLVQERIRWEGLSVMKVLALAAMQIQELSD